jgi:hypothetical protein
MEEDDKKAPETPVAAPPKPAAPEASPSSRPAPRHARPKLSEDRFKGADGKPELPQRTYNYGSKGQLIVVGVLGAVLLALFIFMKLHPHHPHAKTPADAAVAPPEKTAPAAVPGRSEMPDDVVPPQQPSTPQFNFHDDP